MDSQFGIWREDGVNQFDTQLDFIPSELYNLFVTINLNDNTWSADIDGIPLFENSQFSNTGEPIDLGFIAYEWDLTAVTTLQHGDNFLLVADILVDASVDPSDVQVIPAAVTLNDLAQTYDGDPKPATVTTDPAGLAVAITYDGSSVPPTDAGSYNVEATVTGVNYEGTAAGILNISQASANVILGDLAQTYDGDPKLVTATTNPAGLAVTITYDGGSMPPTEAGSYAVEATIMDVNYADSVAGILVVAQAISTVTLEFKFEPSGQISLIWQTSVGWTDQVQYSDDLITWFSDLPNSTFTSENSPGATTFLPENDPTAHRRFYRIRRTQSP